MRKLKIGLDLDGVLCHNLPFWNIYFNANKDRHDHHGIIADEAPDWSYYHDICKKCFDDVLHDPLVIKNYVPYDGAPDMYKFLSTYYGHMADFRFITARPKDAEQVSIDWVYKWFSPREDGHCFVVQGKKGLFSKENGYHLVVDDSPIQIVDYQEHGTNVIIRDQPYNQGIEGTRVFNIEQMEAEIIKFINKNYAGQE